MTLMLAWTKELFQFTWVTLGNLSMHKHNFWSLGIATGEENEVDITDKIHTASFWGLSYLAFGRQSWDWWPLLQQQQSFGRSKEGSSKCDQRQGNYGKTHASVWERKCKQTKMRVCPPSRNVKHQTRAISAHESFPLKLLWLQWTFMSAFHFLFSGKQKDKVPISLMNKPKDRGHRTSRLLSPRARRFCFLLDHFKLCCSFKIYTTK